MTSHDIGSPYCTKLRTQRSKYWLNLVVDVRLQQCSEFSMPWKVAGMSSVISSNGTRWLLKEWNAFKRQTSISWGKSQVNIINFALQVMYFLRQNNILSYKPQVKKDLKRAIYHKPMLLDYTLVHCKDLSLVLV